MSSIETWIVMDEECEPCGEYLTKAEAEARLKELREEWPGSMLGICSTKSLSQVEVAMRCAERETKH
jgi:hypothetical protein